MARGTPIEAIIDSFETMGHTGLVAASLGLSRATVEKRLKDEPGFVWPKDNPPWTPRAQAELRQGYDHAPLVKLAARMGRSPMAVMDEALLLGLTHAARLGPALLRDGIEVTDNTKKRLPKLTGSKIPDIGLIVEGCPAPWARSGEKGGQHFVTADTRKAKDRLSTRMATLPLRLTGNIALALVFFLDHHRQVDVDNLEKLVLDAGNDSGLWRDDSQVTLVYKHASYSSEFPRTEIEIQAYDEPYLKRGRRHWPVCCECQQPFHPKTRKTQPRACSKECEDEFVRETQGVLL